MNQPLSRRKVIQASAAVAAAGYFGFSARSYANIVGSNDDVTVGVIGFKSRGNSHIDAYSKMKGVRLIALSDVDKDVLARGVARLEKGPATKPSAPKGPTTKPVAKADRKEMQGKPEDGGASGAAAGPATKPATKILAYPDLRKMLDNKDIDAITTATPNHWHSLIVVWGCQAGKDVYVEKPVSHNVWEGRKAVEAARKYNKIVQTGTQARANSALGEAYKWVREGGLGKVKVSRGLCYKRRATIGLTEGPQAVPEGVDYDLWLGPAAKEAPHRKQFHYDWHWQWAYGNGDLGNQGIHQMDTARWALNKMHLAPNVLSIGGRFGYKDDGETPNTQIVIQDYGDDEPLLIFEVRGLPKEAGSGLMDKYLGQSVGTVVECENGYLVDSGYSSSPTAFDWKGKQIRKFTPDARKDDPAMRSDHFANFIACVRSRKLDELNADILEGHLSSALCHTGNISYQLGEKVKSKDIRDALKDSPAGLQTYSRFRDHLEDNEVNLISDNAVLGAALTMDPKTEKFTGEHAEKANKLATRAYRAPFVVPESV